jgi:pyridoxal phosphate enzyme (YggS family)
MEDILHNLQIIQKRMDLACAKASRNRDEVKLLLATKTVSPDRILTAIQAGYTLIGENKVQEVKEKFEALKVLPHTSHFIGHLQTNKIKDLLKCNISCIQSLDRLELAEKLQSRLEKENKSIDVFIQVNTSQEESKFGIHPDLAADLVRKVAELDRIRIKGLMTIGLFSADLDKVRLCYQLLNRLKKEIQVPGVELNELSMGMSGDLEMAIEEGATIVRVGTAIFGQRIYPDSYYWNEG